MTLNLNPSFVARQRPYDRGSFRDNAPKARSVAPAAGWLATLLSFLGL